MDDLRLSKKIKYQFEVRKISDERKFTSKKLVTKIGLLVSLIGAIITVLLGIIVLNAAASWEEIYFYLLIGLAAFTVFGDIVGFYRKSVGISISVLVGIIVILIGGLIGVVVNYENLKNWKP
ncbi:MAG: hypothetical protein ACXACO_21380 [Promethearchaeota archaeon]